MHISVNYSGLFLNVTEKCLSKTKILPTLRPIVYIVNMKQTSICVPKNSKATHCRTESREKVSFL